ncbi:HxlR family transcriptional regulator [Lentzea pudingi]|uniref:HxlR family transcriptional regulator n=1 Tax=Lentzea pudingi TaxID=1789439 RepID=A0ABQ2IWA9_9PSEU|nr:HxlR family transcriptional regulator [Lentzea pudingi]
MSHHQLSTCGFSSALGVIAGKWKAAILWQIHCRPLRYGELRRLIPGISEKVLFEQLRAMESDGLIQREVFNEVPSRVEYSLTSAGASLNDAVHTMAEWGRKYRSEDTAS